MTPDQSAVNAYVDAHGWEWQPGDVYSRLNSDVFFVAHDEIHANNLNTEDDWQLKIRVLAGTWLEGRLREMMGECFGQLADCGEDWEGGRWACYFLWPKGSKGIGVSSVRDADTLIQALCAALRAVKEVESG